MDEKIAIDDLPSAPPFGEDKQLGGRSQTMKYAFVALALLVAGGYLTCGQHANLSGPRTEVVASQTLTSCKGNPDDIWDKIAPSARLKWTKCYEDKECAKFSVPLDYANSSGRQAAIALIKLPSKIPPGRDGYLGPVLFNPGGPGGSGVQSVQGRGKQFQTILGDGYDIIGFDPRGIGFTEPSLKLFTDASEGAAWELRHAANPPLNATPDALARDYARWQVFGDLAKERLADAGQYVSTALVARDMLRITEAHGYEKLKYWGFSYGSVLGITFAAMFPDKVERLIVDGVCDTYNYYETQWSNNLRDTDAGLRMVYESCAEAGPEACALYAPDAAGVKVRADAIFAKLKKGPLPVLPAKNATHTSNGADYGLVDYGMARDLVFMFLYSPYGKKGINAALVVSALAAVEKGDGRPLWDLASVYRTKDFKCECDKDKDTEPQAQLHEESTLAIACSDGDVVDDSIVELQAHYEDMAKMSGFAELWDRRISCAGWKIRPKERFRGPFVGNTSHPIMLIGNTADPVTPLWNARKMAVGFKNAAVLHQKSAGHCSLSAASLCTAKVIRDYFRRGVLPHPGKECEVESRIFGDPAPVDTSLLSAEDNELLKAVLELSRDFEVPMLHM